MPWVEAMISDHSETFCGECALIFEDIVKILAWTKYLEIEFNGKESNLYLIVTPRKHHVVKATVRLVNPILSGVDTVLGIRVCSKSIRVYYLVRELAAND